MSLPAALPRIVGAKLPLRPMHVWAIRVRLQIEHRFRDVALFDIALDSKLRGCDVVSLRLADVMAAGALRRRATVIQQKTGRPVQFEITEQARRSLTDWLNRRRGDPDGWLFPSRMMPGGHLSTRQYFRLLKHWVALIGLEPAAYGTHSMRRTKIAMLYRKTGNLRACQLLLGHTKLESTVRYLEVELDDALELSEGLEISCLLEIALACRVTNGQSERMTITNVAMLTAGGLAPCLSSTVGGLIEHYTQVAPHVRIIAYLNGYAGLLIGKSVEVTSEVRAAAGRLHAFGGSPIGNSRVRLTNVGDCIKRGLVQPGQDPLQVAAEQLRRDGVDVLHTIGGDDTNTTAADLAAYLGRNGYQLTVVGLPKTIDNDVVPIRQSLGAWSAAEQGALYARNIIAEHSSNPRMLIVHEVMGRNCGWLTAATALAHHQWVRDAQFAEWLENSAARWDVHGVYVPERPINIGEEAERLQNVMEQHSSVNLFISEGAGAREIVPEMEAAGEDVPRDPFGHVQLDKINPGQWFAKQFAAKLRAEKVLVQKSGYFARSAPANAADLALIRACTTYAVDAALRGESGVVGQDEERGDQLRTIEFDRIAGGKAFDVSVPWFTELLRDLGQA